MDLSTFLIFCIIFIISIAISLMIDEPKYRLGYYMCLALLFLTIMNIYLGITSYIALRNDPGVQGPIGEKGPVGASGPPGKCSYAESCGISNPRPLILGIASDMYNITSTCLDKPSLTTCVTQDNLDKATQINQQINMLEQIAYSTTMAQSDFETKLRVCLQDTNSCMDPNDF